MKCANKLQKPQSSLELLRGDQRTKKKMSTELTFTLVQQAKNKGGDKYTCDTNADFTIYVPQTVSRGTGTVPKQKLKITIAQVVENPV